MGALLVHWFLSPFSLAAGRFTHRPQLSLPPWKALPDDVTFSRGSISSHHPIQCPRASGRSKCQEKKLAFRSGSLRGKHSTLFCSCLWLCLLIWAHPTLLGELSINVFWGVLSPVKWEWMWQTLYSGPFAVIWPGCSKTQALNFNF